MSDENDIIEETQENPEEQEPQGPLAGERLAAARRELQIPVIEIAKELHLDEYKVRALESNDFDVIGAPVFAKGHLRKYAQLVKVDESDVMADYYQLNRLVGAPLVVTGRSRPRPAVALGPWVAAIIVILVIAAAYAWFANRESAPEPPVTGVVAPLPQTPEVTDQQALEFDDEVADVGSAKPNEYSEPSPELADAAAANTGDMHLRISYSGDCWTEITDGNGRRLFFELGKAGRTVDVSGEAPFNVLLGDAANVSLSLDGRSFEIPAADRRGRTARLTIRGS